MLDNSRCIDQREDLREAAEVTSWKPYLSTKELALAIGVSESSIKRWADLGSLRVQKTVGGHRRIAAPEAIRFLRESRTPLVRPEIFGMPPLAAAVAPDPDAAASRLEALLVAGDASGALSLLIGLYLQGQSLAEVIDGPLCQALQHIGGMWVRTARGIFVEHQAMDIAAQALRQLATLLPVAEGPLAFGGAPAGDPYSLPTLAVATVLTGEGFRTRNLGPNLPLSCLAAAVGELQPKLVWVSVSAPLSPAGQREFGCLLAAVEQAGGALLLGGRRVEEIPGAVRERAFVGQSLGELVAWTRGWRAATGRPLVPAGVPSSTAANAASAP